MILLIYWVISFLILGQLSINLWGRLEAEGKSESVPQGWLMYTMYMILLFIVAGILFPLNVASILMSTLGITNNKDKK